ncbi:Dienelactone hydrolase family protein [Schizosaccharomyces pombe]
MPCCPTKTDAAPTNRNYELQGEMLKDVGGMQTYFTGKRSSKVVLIGFMDVFGLSKQIKEGADQLENQELAVYLPDFLNGETATLEMIDPKTIEQKEARNNFMQKLSSPLHWPKLTTVIENIEKIHGQDVKIGAYGFCWGAKVLITYPNRKRFLGIGCAHPAFLDPVDAENVYIPVCFLCSKDEDPEVIDAWKKNFGNSPNFSKSYFETFDEMHHGWMSARANLSDPENRKYFDLGYQIFSKFFKGLT